jgi:hypothetical protein
MNLSNQIEEIRKGLRHGLFTSEAAVSQGIVLPILNALGWPVFNTGIVIPEYSLAGNRVDFALCHPENKPAVFIEVKKVGFTGGSEEQLFKYAFKIGVPMAVLTDGQEWSFYLPGEQGLYNARRVYKLDVLERSVEESNQRLEKYLNYNNVCSGSALELARSDYKNVARKRDIKAYLPKAWSALLKEQDSLLLELLADKVEDMCGYKPDVEMCSQFLMEKSSFNVSIEKEPKAIKSIRNSSDYSGNSKKTHKNFSYVFKDQTYKAKSAKDVMVNVLRILAQEDSDFLTRFVSRKHGRKRRYVAQDKYDLYKDRPDLSEQSSIEFLPGWWVGTNYSIHNIQQIIDLALEVAKPDLRNLISYHLSKK